MTLFAKLDANQGGSLSCEELVQGIIEHNMVDFLFMCHVIEAAGTAFKEKKLISDRDAQQIHESREAEHQLRCKLLSRDIPAEPITNGGSATELDNRNYCPNEWVPKYSPPWSPASPISIQ